MAILNLSVSDELESKFRDAASLYFGNKKGNLAKAATEAFEVWLRIRKKSSEAHLQVDNACLLFEQVVQKIIDQTEAH